MRNLNRPVQFLILVALLASAGGCAWSPRERAKILTVTYHDDLREMRDLHEAPSTVIDDDEFLIGHELSLKADAPVREMNAAAKKATWLTIFDFNGKYNAAADPVYKFHDWLDQMKGP